MKKQLALALAALLVVGSVVGCSSSSSSSSTSTTAAATEAAAADEASAETEAAADTASGETVNMTLILRAGSYADALTFALPEFEAEHNVNIDVQELSFDDLYTGIALDSQNATGTYDLCMVDGSWMAEFTENGVLANLSDMGYSFEDDIIEATTTICKVGDDIYLAPFFGNVTVLMYNKELLAEAGYEPEDIESFEDCYNIALSAYENGHNGFLIRGGSADNILSDFLSHLLAYGGWVVDDNNQPTVDTPEFKAAMEEYLSLYAIGDTMDKDDIVAAISNGDAALAQIWPGWYVPTEDGPANYTTMPSKATSGDTDKKTALQGVWTIGIPANAPHPDLALELLEYVMSPEVQLESIEIGGVPCRYSCLLDDTVLETYPHFETVCAALESGIYRPVIEEWTQFTNILGTEMDYIIQGMKGVDEGLADAQAQLEELMN